MADTPTAYKRSFGLGRGLYYRDRGRERATESKRWNLQLTAAEDALRKDQEEQSLYALAFGAIGAGVGFATGGMKGAAEGWTYGREGGKWTQSQFVSDYKPEDYYSDTDVGKFDVSQKYDIEERNRQFFEADRSRFYKDVTETAQNIGSLWMMYEGGEEGVGYLDKAKDYFRRGKTEAGAFIS